MHSKSAAVFASGQQQIVIIVAFDTRIAGCVRAAVRALIGQFAPSSTRTCDQIGLNAETQVHKKAFAPTGFAAAAGPKPIWK